MRWWCGRRCRWSCATSRGPWPPKTIGTAARSAATWPRKVFDALLIDRKEIKVHNSPVDLMIREIGDTNSLIVFPEGGRSDDRRNRRVQKRAVLPRQEAARPGTGAGAHRQPEPRAAARRVPAGAAVELHHVRPARSGWKKGSRRTHSCSRAREAVRAVEGCVKGRIAEGRTAQRVAG